jgi:hypothetical protein
MKRTLFRPVCKAEARKAANQIKKKTYNTCQNLDMNRNNSMFNIN